MIFATLSLRLLRLFHIFRSFHKTGKFWSDKYLFLYLLLICSIKVLLLFLWTYLDTLRPKITRECVPSAIPPHYQVSIECDGQNWVFWLLATSLYSGILIVFVLFMATQTCHIEKINFKDTKKVNVFIFLITIILAIALILWVLFDALRMEIGAHVCEWLAYFSVTMLCQLCLFSPKLLPLVIKKITPCIYPPTLHGSLSRNKSTLY